MEEETVLNQFYFWFLKVLSQSVSTLRHVFFLILKCVGRNRIFCQLSIVLRMKIFLCGMSTPVKILKIRGQKLSSQESMAKETKQWTALYELCEEKRCPPNLPHYFHLLLPIVTFLLLSKSLWGCVIQNMFQTPYNRLYHLKLMHLKYSFQKYKKSRVVDFPNGDSLTSATWPW